ncbi:MAG: hypothetical protein HYV42_02025 [Candidatus Magasanikbacteria bacterium]|nr:hypothetical protein [Candidatus Magasanikbacteria bacterium]
MRSIFPFRHKSSPAPPRKTLRLGIELELFTLDEKGYLTEGGDRLIARVRKNYPEIAIKPECGKNMIEFTTPPHTEVPDAMLQALYDFAAIAECAQQERLVLYAYGTYPGAFTADFHRTRRFLALEKIFGKQRWTINQRCIGFHLHYSLPWGVFDRVGKILKPLFNSKNSQNLINIYNLCIALDPALTTFTQSSPFYQGKLLGKDARMIVYRGGKEFDYPQGLYANFPQLGALQPFKSTHADIIQSIKERFEEWAGLVTAIGRQVATLTKYGSILDNAWNPVKINAHGTMEVRGMDMNHPDIIIAVAVIVKYLIKAIQERHLMVTPADRATAEPFLFENNIIYIPPDSYVRSVLQREAAFAGLSNEAIYTYCRALLRLAKQFIPANRLPLLQPLEEMLSRRATAADRVIAKAAELGIKTDEELTPAQAAALALSLSHDLYQEIIITKKRLLASLEETT